MIKLDIDFLNTSLAIFMNNQDPQTPRKMKRNGVKNLKRAQAIPEFHFLRKLNPYAIITTCK